MDVSAVLYGKGKKGKGKKDRVKKVKTKDAMDGKGRVPTEWSTACVALCGKWGHRRADCMNDGERDHCGKWGHKRAYCRRKIYVDKGNGNGASAASATAKGPSVGAATYEDWNMEPKPDSWAFAVQVEFVACSA